MIYKPKEEPSCSREDCFANRGGYCIALRDTNFKRECPFYKRKEKLNEQDHF
jgi:hypothetical protein